jgi:hypothetical protein
MTLELSPAWVSAGCAAVGLVGGGLVRWFYGALRDQKEDQAKEILGMRGTTKTLFEKCDAVEGDLQSHKLHVAEKYVNQAMLEKALAPINHVLEKIERDLRDMRKA